MLTVIGSQFQPVQMPVIKPVASNSMETINSSNKNDSFPDAFSLPSTNFSRPGDNPVPLFQLFHASDQPEKQNHTWNEDRVVYIIYKILKCDKCNREFCSPINQRRHIRVQHRLRKLDKVSSLSANADPNKERELLGAFWEKLSVDEAKEVVSFDSIALGGIPGPSVVMALMTIMHKPGFPALPPYYLRAGGALLDIIQGRPSRFPISSQELFSILDDASEKTFLCGAAASLQRYIFNGDMGKMGLETRNLVACISFLLEQKLVTAWLVEKDAEAMRCQKLLVAEEEAAQRRQAELLERKRQRKLRQKEQRSKDQRKEEEKDVLKSPDGALEELSLAESSSSVSTPGSDIQKVEVGPYEYLPALESMKVIRINEDMKCRDLVNEESEQQGGQMNRIGAQSKVHPNSPQQMSNGFCSNQSSFSSHTGGIETTGPNGDVKAPPPFSSNAVWSRQTRSQHAERPEVKVELEASSQRDQRKNHQVYIGTIPVTLEDCSCSGADNEQGYIHKHELPKDKVQDKFVISTAFRGSTENSAYEQRKPVSQHGSKVKDPFQNGDGEEEANVVLGMETEPTKSKMVEPSSSVLEEDMRSTCPKFNIGEAREFLAQRWKEALAGEHWVLAPSGDVEPVSSKCHKVDTHGNAENQLLHTVAPGSTSNGPPKVKFRPKPEKGGRVKYIPKQRNAE